MRERSDPNEQIAQPGDPVKVEDIGHPWSDGEGLPDKAIIHLPDYDQRDIDPYLDSERTVTWRTTGNPAHEWNDETQTYGISRTQVIRYRANCVDLARLQAGNTFELLNTGFTTVRAPEFNHAFRRKSDDSQVFG